MYRRNMLVSVAAAVLAGLLVYFIYQLQLKQLTMQQTVLVVAPKHYIKAGTMLTADMLRVKPLYEAAYQEGMYTSLEQVVGLEALIPLGEGEPVLSWKVESFSLLPSPGQTTVQIPKEYILSMANTIRAGDQVVLYISDSEGESRRLFNEPVRVASVKSAANQEIDDPRNPNLVSRIHGDAQSMYASRRDANGTIDQINLNLTEEEWLIIDQLCKTRKAKLVIAFEPGSILDARYAMQ